MNTRRTGITILLAGIFAVFCLPSNTLAAPPRASSQTARPAPQSGPNVAGIEAALKEHMATEQKLLSRIHDLENTQKKLLEQVMQVSSNESETIQKLQSRIQGLEEERRELLRQPRSNASTDWVLGGAAFFTFALCIILLLRMQRPKTFDESEIREELATLEKTSSLPSDSIPPAPATVIGADPPSAHPFVPVLPDWDSASPVLDSQSLKTLGAKENIKSHDSTIELAEIMLSFGRINSAAEALANFIENNPKEAFLPWLKLLEVYKTNGQHTEFNKIARKLNKTFNVWMVDWDNFNDARASAHGLETMTHIVERLQELWGTRECQAYLQYLLRDTRDETRRGFPLAAIDDILCLNDVLEHHLGPYTGPANAFDSDLMDTAPLTETEDEKSDFRARKNDTEQDASKSRAGEDDEILIQIQE